MGAYRYCSNKNCQAPQGPITVRMIVHTYGQKITCDHCGMQREDDTIEQRIEVMCEALDDLMGEEK